MSVDGSSYFVLEDEVCWRTISDCDFLTHFAERMYIINVLVKGQELYLKGGWKATAIGSIAVAKHICNG